MWKFLLSSKSGTPAKHTADETLLVSSFPSPPMIPQKQKVWSQYLTHTGESDGISDMRCPVSTGNNDGACADHAAPTYTLTSAAGGLTGVAKIDITSTGAGGHGVIGRYTVSSVSTDNTILLTSDPTDGTDETGMVWVIPETTYFVPASQTNDRYITFLNIVIADEGAKFSKFGAGPALKAGCYLYYQNAQETIYAHDDLKTNWDFIRMSLNKTPEGEMKVQKDVEGKVDAYVSVIDFTKLMPPYGIKLDAGANEKFALVVRDDASGVDSFNAVTYGFERFK